MAIAAGILTGGLGGSASSMILGQFNLGFISVTVTPVPPVIPPTQTPSGGTGGDYHDIRPRHKITFVIRHKGSTWEKEYIVDQSTGNIVIRILKVWTNVKNRINIIVRNIKNKLGNIRIKIK